MKTKNSNILRLSDAQIKVLVAGVDCKLSRSSMGWSYDDRVWPTDPMRIHSPATIKSLWRLGLLDSNFIDPRGVDRREERKGVQPFDGAFVECAPHVPKLMVWTSALGSKVLEEIGVLKTQQNLVYQ